MRPVAMSKGCAVLLCAAALLTPGCGTVLPGPRYMVDVADFSLTHDGGSVAYLEDRYRYYPFLMLYHEKHYLYLFDRETRLHRRIAQTDAFSVSPHGPLILYSPVWREHFDHPERTPDFRLIDYESGGGKGFFMPVGFNERYLSYGLCDVEWGERGGITAFVVFRYCPGRRPGPWKRAGEKPLDWHSELWEVRIDPSGDGMRVSGARRRRFDEFPKFRAAELHDAKYLSPDGKTELVFSKYNGYLTFNTSLRAQRIDGSGVEEIVKQNTLINLGQACKYTIYYIGNLGVKSLILTFRSKSQD